MFSRLCRRIPIGLSVLVLLGAATPPAFGGSLKSWDKTKDPTKRFKLLANFNDQAVLDQDTGLVWQIDPLAGSAVALDTAFFRCARISYGGHGGFRLPTVGELTSLFDSQSSNPHLPPGHPFNIVTLGDPEMFWTSTPVRILSSQIWNMACGHDTSVGGTGYACYNRDPDDSIRYWCVRGPD